MQNVSFKICFTLHFIILLEFTDFCYIYNSIMHSTLFLTVPTIPTLAILVDINIHKECV